MNSHSGAQIVLDREQVLELVRRVERIDVRMADLTKRLLGNGQPGLLDQMEQRIRKSEQYIVADKARKAMFGAAGGAVASLLILGLRLWLHL